MACLAKLPHTAGRKRILSRYCLESRAGASSRQVVPRALGLSSPESDLSPAQMKCVSVMEQYYHRSAQGGG